jgi:hypothetical protein
MIFYDLLHGVISFDGLALRLLMSPEVQRLREVSLINTTTPSCASLSDVKRFAHTLGVAHLAEAVQERLHGIPPDQRGLVQATAVLHDVGTGPFGHLLEYLLRERFGWDHERQLRSVLRGDYRPENIHHQIYHGGTLKVRDILDAAGIDWEDVANLAEGKPPLGPVLNGTLDLDNVDNVARMAAHFGLQTISGVRLRALASRIRPDGCVSLDPEAMELVQEWQRLRARCYELLMFDPATLSCQAMLHDAMQMALNEELIGQEYWHYTEGKLLDTLERHSTTARLMQRLRRGDLYECIGVYWLHGTALKAEWDADLRQSVSSELSRSLGVKISLYAFRDRGAVSKAVALSDESGHQIVVGADSNSLVCAVFRMSGHDIRAGWRTSAAEILISAVGCGPEALMRIPCPEEPYGISSQTSLPF